VLVAAALAIAIPMTAAAHEGHRPLLGATLSGAGAVRAEEPPSPLPLDWCLERAASANPRIEADREALRAATERIVPAGALDDPRLGYEASNVPVDDLDFDSTPMSGQQLRLMQRVPFPGLLANREEAARAGAEAAEEDLEDRRLVVASAVETAWAELGFAQRALAITERNIDLVRQLNSSAEAKYRVGTGLQQDVLRAQVQLTSLLDERLRRVAAIDAASARLAALLDLPDASFPDTAELADLSPLPPLEPLLSGLVETSPRLRALAARVEEAERKARVAALEGYPDFDLGVGYRVRQRTVGDPVRGDDFLSAGVTVRLPVNRSRWRAQEAEKRALFRREAAHYRAARADLFAAVRAAHAELVRADSEAVLLTTGLVPQARQSLDSSRAAYEVGRIDFLSLLDSQVRLLGAELRRVRAVADRRVAFAALEAAAGEDLR
jgi:outer membrane protein TolC